MDNPVDVGPEASTPQSDSAALPPRAGVDAPDIESVDDQSVDNFEPL